MHFVQATCSKPPADSRFPDPGSEELLPADHAVLGCRKLRNPFCVPKAPLSGHNGTQTGHGAILSAEMSRNA
jgi:hypothetical protein